MAFRHGRKVHITIQDSGGTARDISAYSDTSQLQRTIETAEVTSYQNDNKAFIAGLHDATFSMGGSWDSVLDGYLAGIIQYDGTRNIVYGPESSTSGRVRYTLPIIMTSFNISPPVGDKVAWNGEFQISGAVTRDTY
jgi:hypothetical protein